MSALVSIIRDTCGTYGGYRKHQRLGETACGPCRAANTAYMQQYRADRADERDVNRRLSAARSRAAWALVDRHRDEWHRLVIEELEKP